MKGGSYEVLLSIIYFIYSFLSNSKEQSDGGGAKLSQAKLLDQYIGLFKCAWNKKKEQCTDRGCFWYRSECYPKDECSEADSRIACPKDKCIYNEGQCLSFQKHGGDSIALSSDLKTVVMQHRVFMENTALGTTVNHFEGTGWDDLSSVISSYAGDSYKGIREIFRKHYKKYGNSDYDKIDEPVFLMNHLMLLLPKLNKSLTVYRGLRECDLSLMQKPEYFVSTSLSEDVARKFSKNCMLKIDLPPGFPFYSMDYSMRASKFDEKEILLPGIVLSYRGDLERIEFEIVKEEIKGEEKYFHLRPKNNLTKNEGKSEDVFAERYIKSVCGLDTHSFKYKYMCAKAKLQYGIALDDKENNLLDPSQGGIYNYQCKLCIEVDSKLTCTCGDKEPIHQKRKYYQVELDTQECSTGNIYFDVKEKSLKCSEPLPRGSYLKNPRVKKCSRFGETLSCYIEEWNGVHEFEGVGSCKAPQSVVYDYQGFGHGEMHCTDTYSIKLDNLCSACRVSDEILSCRCPINESKVSFKISECENGNIVYVSDEHKLKCLDPGEEFSMIDDCLCYSESSRFYCQCPSGHSRYSDVYQSSVSRRCIGDFVIHNRQVICKKRDADSTNL